MRYAQLTAVVLVICDLMVSGQNFIKSLMVLLEITDGNLDAHLRKLIGAGYIESEKRTGKGRPQTIYSISAAGKTAFENYLETLKKLLSVRF